MTNSNNSFFPEYLRKALEENGDLPPDSQQQTFRLVVQAYRQAQDLSLRDFADALSDHETASFSYQTIKNWEDGATVPSRLELIGLTVIYIDWRRDFAIDCLAALRPQIFKPAGEIGRRLVKPISPSS